MTPDLLDILHHTDTYQWPALPGDGYVYGWRSTNPDLRSSNGYRWPWPGGVATSPDDGRDLSHDHPDQECPSNTRGGLCLARTWTGARSGGIRATVALLVAYRPDDILGSSDHKLRVSEVHVLDVIELRRLNLRGADLRGADLQGAWRSDINTSIPGWTVTNRQLEPTNPTKDTP